MRCPTAILGAILCASFDLASCSGAGSASKPPPAVSKRVAPGYRTPLEAVFGSTLIALPGGARLNTLVVNPAAEKTLVFIHGDAGTFDVFTPQVRHFGGRYRLILYERADCGRSSAGSDGLSYSLSAHNLRGLLKKLRVPHYVLIGHSRGQEIGAVFFSGNPAGLRGFVASGSSVSVTPSEKDRQRARREIANRGLAGLRAECYQGLVRRADVLAKALELSLAGAKELLRYSCTSWRPHPGIRGGLDIVIRDSLAKVQIPMLQVDGAEYRKHVDRHRTMQAHYADSRLVMLPNAGHMPHIEVFQLFNSTVDGFLQEIGY